MIMYCIFQLPQEKEVTIKPYFYPINIYIHSESNQKEIKDK